MKVKIKGKWYDFDSVNSSLVREIIWISDGPNSSTCSSIFGKDISAVKIGKVVFVKKEDRKKR